MYTPKKLTLWQHPESYYGAAWPDYYVFLSQSRDSDALTRSNFGYGLKLLGGESESVQVIRERHWACGWIEWIGIEKSDFKALEIADKIMMDLESYPVLNEDHFSEIEYSESENYWQQLPINYRVELCQDANISIFAARHDYIPMQDNGYIFEKCIG
jgi:hypothetical protein